MLFEIYNTQKLKIGCLYYTHLNAIFYTVEFGFKNKYSELLCGVSVKCSVVRLFQYLWLFYVKIVSMNSFN